MRIEQRVVLVRSKTLKVDEDDDFGGGGGGGSSSSCQCLACKRDNECKAAGGKCAIECDDNDPLFTCDGSLCAHWRALHLASSTHLS